MRKSILSLFVIFSCLLPGSAYALEFVFATSKEGREILLSQNSYFSRLSPPEIAIRMQSNTADKTFIDLKAHYGDNILEWTEEEKAQYREVFDANMALLAPYAYLLPEKIVFIKVNDNVEGGLPHTHANAIIISESVGELTQDLFLHETFHVLSRNNRARHDTLYGVVGFQSCQYIETPDVREQHLTNPDEPLGGFYLPVTWGGEDINLMTYLFAATPVFDPTVEGGFPGHFGFGLLRVDVQSGVCTVAMREDGEEMVLDPDEVPQFFDAIGRNTGYIIHAEEVLAVNFVLLLTGAEDLASPEVPERLKAWLEAEG